MTANTIHFAKTVAVTPTAVILLLAVLAILASNYLEFHDRIVGPHHAAHSYQLNKDDPIDVPPLLLRISECKTFLQTRSYWHEDYTPGVPFYRPLSLTWFWLEYHIAGTRDFGNWTLVSICLQLVFCALFALFIQRLTGSLLLASIAIFVFAGSRSIWPYTVDELFVGGGRAPAIIATAGWKDQATQLSDIAILCTLLLTLQKKWLFALAIAVVSVLFKESGWTSFALALITLALTGELRRLPRWVYFATAVAIAIPMSMRLAAGMGLIGGLQIGSNKFWFVRYVFAVCGPYIVACIKSQWQAAVLGSLLLFVCRWNQRFLIIKILAAAAALVTCAIIGSFANGQSVVVNIALLIDPGNQLPTVILCFLYTVGVVCLALDKEMLRVAVRMVPFVVVSTLPFVAASQVGERALNLSSAFQSVVNAAAIVATSAAGAKYIASLRKSALHDQLTNAKF